MGGRWIEWFLFLCVLMVRTAAVSSGKESDLVTGLPGQPSVGFRHYAGYVKLRPNDQKALFYWFFEAQDNVPNRSLVLWLNGGPGCSSIGYGAAQELGPFLARDQFRLTLNRFSWNKVANMLFLEAPVGVGFSYSNNSMDLNKLGDRVTAVDSHAFLLNWFKKFPEFKSNEFYVAGESYAGHYVPQLAEVIYDGNRGASKNAYINLKGFMIGNAVMNHATDMSGLVDYAWSHAIISDTLYAGISKECDFEQRSNDFTKRCEDNLQGFMDAYSDIDMYSIYTPVCLTDAGNRTSKKLLSSPRFLTRHDWWHRLPAGYDPCTDDYVEKYFNREDVQRALHANVTKLSYPYSLCSSVIKEWSEAPTSVLPIIRKLLKAGMRIWVYSGDTDGRVPVTSTRYSIKKMGLKVEKKWRAWFHKQQVAGWVETYDGGRLTFATVRGAGHQVPVFAPQQSLSLFTHFLSSNRLPSSR